MIINNSDVVHVMQLIFFFYTDEIFILRAIYSLCVFAGYTGNTHLTPSCMIIGDHIDGIVNELLFQNLILNVTMSDNIKSDVIDNSNEWINWIEEAISKKRIKYYEYEYFYNFKEVGTGSFGQVYRVNWKDSHDHLALKSFFNFNNAMVKEIVHEVMIK